MATHDPRPLDAPSILNWTINSRVTRGIHSKLELEAKYITQNIYNFNFKVSMAQRGIF